MAAWNGSPSRGIADGENSAWSIYTPQADFGNAEITELFYPIMYLGRNVEPDLDTFYEKWLGRRLPERQELADKTLEVVRSWSGGS